MAKKDVYAAIKSEMSGDLREGMQAIGKLNCKASNYDFVIVVLVRCVHSRPMYFAEKLYKSMKGAGTDDTTLIRIVVSRCEVFKHSYAPL